MRSESRARARRNRLFILLGLGLAALPAASPYVAADTVPRTNDLLPHLYRVVALLEVWSPLRLWPRWSPDLVGGFGYPVFHFFPALSHMAVAALGLALPLTLAYRLVVFLHAWLAAIGAFWFGRTLSNRGGGWLAALAYVYSPYLLYDAGVRGSLPESQALALLPFLALAVWGAAHRRRAWVIALPLLFAAMFLSHFPVTAQSLLVLVPWALWLGWRAGRWRGLLGPVVGLTLGVGLTAFFWLPALVEIGFTRAGAAISMGYNLADNFLSLRELLALPLLPVDPALINPPVVRPLPLAALALALATLAFSWRRLDGGRRRLALGFGLLLLPAVWLITPSSRWIWGTVPLLADTLYPWRLLGVISWLASALLALAAAGLPGTRERPGRRPIWPVLWPTLGTIALLAAAAPWLFLPQEPAPADPGLPDLARFEAPPLFIGTTTLGEFLPATVTELPDTTEQAARLAAGEKPDRLEPCALAAPPCPAPDPLDATYRLDLPAETTLRFHQFYFPGWLATLDGVAWSLRADADGVISLDVPAGDHTLRLWWDGWDGTRARLIGNLLSLWSLLGLLPLTAMLWPRLAYRGAAELLTPRPAGMRPGWLLLLGLAAVGVWALLAVVDSPVRRPRLTADGLLGVPAPPQGRLDVAGEVWLLGVDGSERVAADDPILLDTYWQAQRPIGVPYLFGVHVRDERGLDWARPDVARPRDWRFVGNDPWPLDAYRLEPFVIHLIDGAPPGRYQIEIGLVRADTRETVATATVRELIVTVPANGERPLADEMTPLPAAAAAHGLRLLGVKLDRAEARPGDPARVGLLFEALGPGLNAFTLELVDASGNVVWNRESPVVEGYPPERWRDGDRLRAETLLRFPASLSTGAYTWRARWGLAEPVTLGSVMLTAPERRYAVPPLDVVGEAELGGVARLLGATVVRREGELVVTLAWQSLAETGTSYRVFLHLRDEEDRVVAQSDGEPAEWTRPTSGWLPGEVVVDPRRLELPADAVGGLRLVAGLYDPATGVRLRTPTGEDGVLLMVVELP